MRTLLAILILTSTAHAATVTERSVIYRTSAWDRYSVEVNEYTTQATATDKEALLPGGTATFTNYTSYSKGINCICVDGLDGLNVADLTIKVGNSNTPSTWATGPTPVVTERAGKHYLTFETPILKQWVQVTITANSTTGLASDDVFYFGNAVGETGDAANAVVGPFDLEGTQGNGHTPSDPAAVDDRYDFDRDGLVGAYDEAIVTGNATSPITALKLITVP